MHPEFWCQQTLRISVAGPDGSTSQVVDKPFALVGADARSDIVLPDQSIPSRKLYLHAAPDGVFCVDLAPGRPDKQKMHGWLEPDRPVNLGPYVLRVTWGDGKPVPGGKSRRKLDAQGTLPEPRPKLIARYHGQEIGRGAVTRQLSVLGRSKPSSMIIKSHVISGCHCALVWVADECWVVDLLSANGTYLNGSPLTAAKLHPGDVLVLGKVEVSYLPSEPAASSLVAAAPEEGTKSGVGAFEDFEIGGEMEEAADESDEPFLAGAVRLTSTSPSTESERAAIPQEQALLAAESNGRNEQLALLETQLQAERAALAARQEAVEKDVCERLDSLHSQQTEFSQHVATWEAARQQEELRLAEVAKRLETEAARIAAEAAGLETQRVAFAAAADAWREQTALQQRQLDTDRAHFAGRQEAAENEIGERSDLLQVQQAELRREVATWEAARQQEELRLAEEAKRLEAEAARIAAEAAGLEAQRMAFAADAAALPEQTASRQQRLDTERTDFTGRQEAAEKDMRKRSDLLQEQEAELSQRVATWEAACQKEKLRLAEVAKRLETEAARIDAEASCLETQRAAFVAEVAAWREQIAVQERQLDTDRAHFAGRQEAAEREMRERSDLLQVQQAELSRQVANWEAARQQEELRSAEVTKRLETEAARIAAEAAGLETRRTAFVAEVAAWREQTARQQRQLDADRAHFAGLQEAAEKEISERSDSLHAQQTEFSRQVATWEAARQQEELRLAEGTKRSAAEAARIAAEAAGLETQRAAFAAEAAAWREQTAMQQRQLDTDLAHFAGRQEAVEKGLRERSDALQAQQAEFSRQVATWEAARQQEELRLAEGAEQLETEVARIAAEAAGLETQRAAFAAEAATFHEQTTGQRRQLDADRARFAGQQEALEKELSERLAALRTQQADSSCQLAKEQADFSHQVMTWEAECRREERRLAEEAKRLEAEAAKIAAEAASLETRRTTFKDEMVAGANALRVQQEQLSRQAADWESKRQQEASRLAAQAQQLEAEGAEVAARAVALASERAGMRQELARETGLAPRQTDGEDQDETRLRSQTGRDQPPENDDPLAVLRRTWQQGADKERHATFRVRLILFAAATACLAVLAAVVWWNYPF